MMIALCFFGEICTIFITYEILMNGNLDTILQIPENGYKISKEIINIYEKTELETTLKEKLIYLIPFINIILSINKVKVDKETIMRNEYIKNNITKMSDDEFKEYQALNFKMQKLVYATNKSQCKKITDYKPAENDFYVFNSDKIFDFNLSFNEVLNINSLFKLNYKVGTVCDKNVAIIGTEGNEKNIIFADFNEVEFENVKFKEINIADAGNKRFQLYTVKPIDIQLIETTFASIRESEKFFALLEEATNHRIINIDYDEDRQRTLKK